MFAAKIGGSSEKLVLSFGLSIVPNHINFTVNTIIITIKWSSALKWWLRQALKVSLNSTNRKLWSLELFIMSTNEATDRLTDKLMKNYFSQCVNSSSRRCQLKLINVSWKLSKISIFSIFIEQINQLTDTQTKNFNF